MSSENAIGPPYVGAMIRILVEDVQDQILRRIHEAGYTDFTVAHVKVFRYPSPDGLRPSELADHQQVTKQSINDVLGYLEDRGYLVREPDPEDGRARRIRLTSEGHSVQAIIGKAARSAEEHYAQQLGPTRFKEFRRSLSLLVDKTDHYAGPSAD